VELNRTHKHFSSQGNSQAPKEALDMAIVLIVENDVYQRQLLEQELKGDGYEVWLVEDGREAVCAVRERRPDVVVLDLNMPRMDGLETLPRLLEVDYTLPVIIHTAYSYYKDNYLSWLAEDYVIKSSNLAPLKSAIRRTMDRQVAKSLWGKPR
jgi:DNA-binding response OmpR family regulator